MGGSHISAAVVCLFRQQRQTCSAINMWISQEVCKAIVQWTNIYYKWITMWG